MGAKLLILFCSYVGGLACAEFPAYLAPLGPRAAHMASHVLLISAVAPALAHFWLRYGALHRQSLTETPMLVCAATAQLALLWAWHAPVAFAVASVHLVSHALASMLLLGASLTFWLALFSREGARRLQGVFVLLATGKLSCLLGALLLFSPRILDRLASSDLESALSDQRLAGLMMLAACPLCYVLTGIKMTADWLRELETGGLRLSPASAQAFPCDGVRRAFR